MSLVDSRGELVGSALLYGGAMFFETVRVGGTLIGGKAIAGGYAAIYVVEKAIHRLAEEVLPDVALGPTKLGLRKAVSYSAATWTVMKVMQVAGLILSIHTGITALGCLSIAALAMGIFKNFVWPLIEHREEIRDVINSASVKTTVEVTRKVAQAITTPTGKAEELIAQHLTSKTFANELFTVGKGQVRILVNPELTYIKCLNPSRPHESKSHFILFFSKRVDMGTRERVIGYVKDAISQIKAQNWLPSRESAYYRVDEQHGDYWIQQHASLQM